MTARPNDPAVSWGEDEVPRSGRFGDVYFSAEDGLAESRAVFLSGAGLPDRWRGRPAFTVAELGFGSGLNIAALLDLWRRERPADGRLHVFSVEAFPMGRGDAARALGRWPELMEVAGPMLARWPAATPGFHRVDYPEFAATLDLAVMDAGAALNAWSGAADAWFLDGFAPSTNPGMWSDEILALVAARSAPGAVAATFTVAGAVRRGLRAQGFTVDKKPGFGRKRERLEARLEGVRPAEPLRRVAVVGAGIAGAALAWALRSGGAEATVIEAEKPGAGASGNPAGLVTPRFDAGGGATAALFAQAFERAHDLYGTVAPEAVIARGVLQLEASVRDSGRFDRIAAQALWPDGALTRLEPAEVAERLGEPVDRGGLCLADGLVVDNLAILDALLGDTPVTRGRAHRIDRAADGWVVLDESGRPLARADAVIVAAGWGLAALHPALSVTPARGQATWAAAEAPVTPAAWGGYAIPTRDGFLFGATFDRGETTHEARTEDTARNLATLREARPQLAALAEDLELGGRARVRVTTRDHLPVAGQVEPGLWVLGGLGSRGLTTAPLLAEHVAACLLGRPSPLPRELSGLLEPSRPATSFPESAAVVE